MTREEEIADLLSDSDHIIEQIQDLEDELAELEKAP